MVGTGTARVLHTQPKINDVESLLGVIMSRNSVDEKTGTVSLIIHTPVSL